MPNGLSLGQRYTPVERVALYAPNGRASYPSTVLMLAVPARVARVPQIVLCTPASPDGSANAAILAAARIAGISEIYKIGGAAAAAALTFGTATVPKVDKIVGPGSIYFTFAKKHLYGLAGIDGLYGPSEVVIMAQEGAASPAQLAADLLAQAEHGADAFVCLITNSSTLLTQVQQEVEIQLKGMPREALARQALDHALMCSVQTMEEACALADESAAEHVEIWSADAGRWSHRIRNAGAIFLNTPVPVGDYVAGPSHTLPTGGTARFASGVGVDTFLKRTSIISAPTGALAPLCADLETIAQAEQLHAHAAAVRRACGR